jgi:hypothetical protein
MSLLTGLSNKLQYMAVKTAIDPEAEEYAKQQAEQAAQDAAMKKQKEDAEKEAKAGVEEKLAEDKKADALAARSQFDTRKMIGQASKGILSSIFLLIIIFISFYGGHIAANKAIGWGVPFRILSFIYGILFSFWVIPKSIYDVYWKGLKIPYFTFLPISTHETTGTIEKIFIGPFCYREDEESSAARAAVVNMYADAFRKSQPG